MSKPWYFKKWGKDKMCAITQSRLRPGKDKFGISYVTTLDCKHSFYTKALLDWSSKNQTCPICRSPYNFLMIVFKEYIINN